MIDLNGQAILLTGGTGSFGKKFAEIVLDKFPEIKKLVIFSRDELKQFEMSQDSSLRKHPNIKFLLGDVRDKNRLNRVLKGIDIVIHAAALKQVSAAENNPMEFIKTNILGAENLIDACINCGVKKVIALSTDKAAAPINLYGATKLCSDKLFVAANNISGGNDIKFAIVRYGNVMGSRGSVIPFFMEKRKTGVLPITNPEMTRFNITLEAGVDFVLEALSDTQGGEIYVPKLPSYNIKDVATAIGPECEHKIIGIRAGEKIHEEMIIESDASNTLEFDRHYIIHPSFPNWSIEERIKKQGAKKVPIGFKYSSELNNDWMSVEKIRKQIQLNIDPDFSV